MSDESARRIVKERGDLRRILGDRYEAEVAPFRQLIRDGMAKHGVDAITVCIALAKAGMAAGRPVTASYASAALCDVLEASDG